MLLASWAYVITTGGRERHRPDRADRVGLMVLIVAAALVYVVDIQRATGGKTMAELRTEKQVLDSPSQPS